MTIQVTKAEHDNQTSPRWMHWLNLIFISLVIVGAGLMLTFFLASPTEISVSEITEIIDNRTVYLLVYVFGFVLLMGIFAIVGSICKLSGKSNSINPKWINLIFGLFITAGILLIVLEQFFNYPDWLYGLATFLAVLTPALFFLKLFSGRLLGKHLGRDASVISFTANFSLPYIMIIQLLLVFIGVFVGMMVLLPNLITSSTIMQDLELLLASPELIIISAVILVGIIAPITEELFKTIAVWPLLGRKLSAREGYLAGMMSGFAFAVIEGGLYATQLALISDGDLTTVLLGRMGGSLIHMFNGALIGWALAKGKQDRNHARTIVIYIITMAIHALWNLIAVFSQTIPSLLEQNVNEVLSTGLLLGMSIVLFLAFVIFSRNVFKENKITEEI